MTVQYSALACCRCGSGLVREQPWEPWRCATPGAPLGPEPEGYMPSGLFVRMPKDEPWRHVAELPGDAIAPETSSISTRPRVS